MTHQLGPEIVAGPGGVNTNSGPIDVLLKKQDPNFPNQCKCCFKLVNAHDTVSLLNDKIVTAHACLFETEPIR